VNHWRVRTLEVKHAGKKQCVTSSESTQNKQKRTDTQIFHWVSPTVCGLPEEAQVQVDEKLAVVCYIRTEAMTHISTVSNDPTNERIPYHICSMGQLCLY